jgi:hypothetical protein
MSKKTELERPYGRCPTTIRKLEIWKLHPTNQGFREAQNNPIWEPDPK